MTGWLIALGILALIAILPVGVGLIYSQDGLVLSLLVGMIKIKLLPKPPKEKTKKQKKKKETSDQKKKSKKNGSEHKPKEKKKSGGKVTDFLPLLDVAFRFLSSFWRKLRVKRMEVNYIMAGGDPCDLALNYGKAWEAVGNIIPYLDRIFVIRKRDIQVQCDFAADTASIYVRLDISITIGRVIGIAVKYGFLALREFMKIKSKRKGGALK